MRFSTIVGIFTLMLTLVTGLVFAEHEEPPPNFSLLFYLSCDTRMEGCI
ncbi:MAG: hypothetical protein V3U19_01750 [Thermodesulfobacteriota bacterium]|jgi:hypothetical protein